MANALSKGPEAKGKISPIEIHQPVKAIDATTNYYRLGGNYTHETPKMNGYELKATVDAGFNNMHGNLLNEGDDHEDTQGQSNKVDRLKAMARRMGKAY